MENEQQARDRFQIQVFVDKPQSAISLLQSESGLSKTRLKKIFQFGAVWIKRDGRKRRRLRTVNFPLKNGDCLDLYYDSVILSQPVTLAIMLRRENEFSIWYKPKGLLTQGSNYGDFHSLLRQAKQELALSCEPFLIHRLDREACGIVLLAHTKKAAAALSRQFAKRLVTKKYWARVHGQFSEVPAAFEITSKIDAKSACTRISVGTYCSKSQTTEIFINLLTGRFHQIRRHLARIEHPICGDKRYGFDNNKNATELQLCAWQLGFYAPYTNRKMVFSLPDELLPFKRP